jgi:hypothetical protein
VPVVSSLLVASHWGRRWWQLRRDGGCGCGSGRQRGGGGAEHCPSKKSAIYYQHTVNKKKEFEQTLSILKSFTSPGATIIGARECTENIAEKHTREYVEQK